MPRLLIVGGSDAGVSAALRARQLDPGTTTTLVVADAYPNYSICGLPYYLSGEVADWRDLAHRTAADLERAGIELLLDHVADAIDPVGRTVAVDGNGRAQRLPYDRLLVATGAASVRPRIAGLDLPGVHLLHTMEDSFRVHRQLTEGRVASAVVVGTGYIGLELADALIRRGLRVTVVGRAETVLPTVDPALGRRLEDELRRHGVEVVDGVAVDAVAAAGGGLVVSGSAGFREQADLVLVAAGVRPASELAAAAGARTGARGAICVDGELRTNVPDLFAAGDCAETWHRLLGRFDYLPLGTTAHKQGRVAGENAVGGSRRFEGVVGTQVVKVFDLAAARTGLLEREARAAGFDPVTSELTAWDHKRYYPGAQELVVRLTADRRTGKLLGAQLLGHWRSEVAKRIDIFAAALYHGMTVEALNDLDLSYTPPLSSPWDPVQAAAQVWSDEWGGGTAGDTARFGSARPQPAGWLA